MKRPNVVNAGAPKSRGKSGRWAYGINAVRRRLEVQPQTVLEVCVADRRSARVRSILELVPSTVPVRDVGDVALRQIAGAAHQGIAARTTPYEYGDLVAALTGTASLLLAVDQMQDPQNFGALLRTAAAAGVAAVVIPRDGSVGVTPAAEKAAAGAINDVPVCQVVNLRRALDDLAAHGYWRVGLVAHANESIFDMQVPERIVLVLGGETGIRPLVLDACDYRVSIPMRPAVESLNAAAAAAIALFEIIRRQ